MREARKLATSALFTKCQPLDTVNLISGIELASAAEQLFVDPDRVMITNNDLTLSKVDGCKILPGEGCIQVSDIEGCIQVSDIPCYK